MKAVERKLNKAQIATIWLLIISVLLAGAYVLSIVIVNKRARDEANKAPSGTTVEIQDGESLYLNTPVAYPQISESEILFVEIDDGEERFGVSRYPNDDGSFMFHYYEGDDKKAIPYVPPIVNAEGKFDYESLYAIETADGFGQIYYLTYLCSALGTPFFTERIELPSADTPEGAEKRETLLRNYGLTQSESTMISFEFCERDEETNAVIEGTNDWHIVVVGGKALSDSGYYFMVDGRDCVYYTNSEYFKYALSGFSSFVNGALVAEGLPTDKGFGPYLTPDFKSWMGKMFEEETDRIFTSDMQGYEKYENPTVVATGSYKTSIDKGLDFDPGANGFSGYETENEKALKFDLQALREHPDYLRIKNAFVGQSVSAKPENIILTMIDEVYTSEEKLVSFGDADTVEYVYNILQIESVITDSGERTSGTVESSDTLLKVTYRYTVGGKEVKHDCHAVIDLNNLTDGEKAKFVGKTVGSPLGSEAFDLNVIYTKGNGGAILSNEKYVLTGILSIFDDKGASVDTVTENTYVNISYYTEIDGDKSDTKTTIIRLVDIKEGDKLFSLKTLLPGKGKGDVTETVYNNQYRYEFMREFTTYEISKIDYFVANEMIVSFEFVQASERDPFYADVFYKNTLENEYGIYGLNAGSCEEVVKLLGGVGSDGNSASGLSGETVAIGLSLENMKEYGLYAHKVYFKLPRGLFDESEQGGGGQSEEDNDVLSDFGWVSELGFTLYISDAHYENGQKYRYIGSDMYDIVAKVVSDEFDFVEYGFVEFWARKNMVMVDIADLREMKLEFNMEDLKGEYDFEISFKTIYEGKTPEGYVHSEEKKNGYSPIEWQTVKVRAGENAFDTEYKRLFGTNWGDLSSLYDVLLDHDDDVVNYYQGSKKSYGAAYFNSLYENLLFTDYLDVLTEEEQEAGRAKPKVMSMSIAVEGKNGYQYYKYDFYRIDDRRVMVSLYTIDSDGNKTSEEVSDFYITTFAFKKLVNNYIDVLNGRHFDENTVYP